MARLPDIESEQSKLTTVLRSMSNAKRMRILNELSDGRERSVSELEGVIASLSQSALSQHLARLRRANIVRTRRESQTIYYSIDDSDALDTQTSRPYLHRRSGDAAHQALSAASRKPLLRTAPDDAVFHGVFCDNSLPFQNIPRRIHRDARCRPGLSSDPVNQTRICGISGSVFPG